MASSGAVGSDFFDAGQVARGKLHAEYSEVLFQIFAACLQITEPTGGTNDRMGASAEGRIRRMPWEKRGADF